MLASARGCNRCEYLYINGIGCHETGCPNNKRVPKCYICGFEVTTDDGVCDCESEVI